MNAVQDPKKRAEVHQLIILQDNGKGREEKEENLFSLTSCYLWDQAKQQS
jgi:hypothetical protein